MNLFSASTYSLTDLMRAPNEVNNEVAPLEKAKGKAKATVVEPQVLCGIQRTTIEETRYFRLRVLRTIIMERLGMYMSCFKLNYPLLMRDLEDMIGQEAKYSWAKFLDCAIEHKLCLMNWRMNTFVPGIPVLGKTWKWSILPVGPVKDMVNSIESGEQAPHFVPWSSGRVKHYLLSESYTDCLSCDRSQEFAYVRHWIS